MATGTLPAATLIAARDPVNAANGVAPTASDGDYLSNSGKEYLSIYNPESDTLNITFDIPTNVTVDGQSVTDKQVTVAASKRALVGPFPTQYYNDTQSRMKVTCSFSGGGVLANVRLKPVRFA